MCARCRTEQVPPNGVVTNNSWIPEICGGPGELHSPPPPSHFLIQKPPSHSLIQSRPVKADKGPSRCALHSPASPATARSPRPRPGGERSQRRQLRFGVCVALSALQQDRRRILRPEGPTRRADFGCVLGCLLRCQKVSVLSPVISQSFGTESSASEQVTRGPTIRQW